MLITTEPVTVYRDERGALIKAWPAPVSGEVYVIELLPGCPRGHHYHVLGGEWFIPLSGRARLTVSAPDGSDHTSMILAVGERARVEAGVAHVLTAEGGPALVAAVADLEHRDEETIPCPVALP
ncbi:MAG: oxalate decarboxylase/phosphoglucose isomerase-like protein (cupin superfamily) [Myxococcota bacterium]|jgi:oxalate decarboxylase/phosphoglucose isomerase-like protein (cupin superfamily)